MIFTKTATKSTKKVTLPKEVFSVDVKDHSLLKLAYDSNLAEHRSSSAYAKNRSDVRGGGRKPWRQKGTGRARVGSIRSPLWRGGGAIFGPTGNENKSKRLSQKQRRTALKQALSLANKQGKLNFIETFETKGSASDAAKLLDKTKLEGRILLVVSVKDGLVDRAINNLANVKAVQADYLTARHILDADNILMSFKSVDHLKKVLG